MTTRLYKVKLTQDEIGDIAMALGFWCDEDGGAPIEINQLYEQFTSLVEELERDA